MNMKLRDELKTFCDAIEDALSKHDPAKGDSWKTIEIKYLRLKLIEEISEYLGSHKKEEIVDIGAICMMLYNKENDSNE